MQYVRFMGRAPPVPLCLSLLLPHGLLLLPNPAQTQGVVSGVVTEAVDGLPLGGVTVALVGTALRAITTPDGHYAIARVPAGPGVLRVSLLGYRTEERRFLVGEGDSVAVDVRLQSEPIQLSTLVVEGVSRGPETLIKAPAAVSVLSPGVRAAATVSGQAPQAFVATPGLDLVQNGVQDFNVNARGFNASLSRSVLVLQDGRDLSVPFLGSQEWAGLSIPMDGFDRVEVIRGPGSALYGANAFTGVVNMTTPAARDVVGTRLSMASGELGTLRADVRHAGVAGEGRFGYRVNLGYTRSGSWARSRTRIDGSDFAEEYSRAGRSEVNPPSPGYELTPVYGQVRDPETGEATGEAEDLESIYASGRLDHYGDDGSVLTLDGGFSRVRNTLFMTAIGRVQVLSALRPWARIAWEADGHSISAWYSGRLAGKPQVLLSSALPIDDASSLLQVEGQIRRRFFQDRGSLLLGGSAREARVDTKGTLMVPTQDRRNDRYVSAFGELEYRLSPRVQLIAAGRLDRSDLFHQRFSPKGGIVFALSANHTIRMTANRAFLTPSQVEFFLDVTPATQDLSLVEEGLRASPLGPALTGVPQGELFTLSSSVPVMARGNPDLEPETVTSFEAGYKGQIGIRLFATVDAYFSRVRDLVTTLLPAPAVNPSFDPWTAPPSVPEAYQRPLENAVRAALAGTPAEYGLTRLPDGSTAIVMSYGNAGKVDEWGLELSAHVWITNRMSLAGTYTYFDFEVREAMEGDVLLPNTPRHKGTASLEYSGRKGLDLAVHARFVESYDWASGVFMGRIPASQPVDILASYQLTPIVGLNLMATNLFNQQRFHIYGGSVNGRRVLGGLALTF